MLHSGQNGTNPTAFIPFCSLGYNLEALSNKTDNFSVPVCTGFTKTIMDGQLCYEVDASRFLGDVNKDMAEFQKVGLSLLVDTNSEYDMRQVLPNNKTGLRGFGFPEEFLSSGKSEQIVIHVESISKMI